MSEVATFGDVRLRGGEEGREVLKLANVTWNEVLPSFVRPLSTSPVALVGCAAERGLEACACGGRDGGSSRGGRGGEGH